MSHSSVSLVKHVVPNCSKMTIYVPYGRIMTTYDHIRPHMASYGSLGGPKGSSGFPMGSQIGTKGPSSGAKWIPGMPHGHPNGSQVILKVS